MISQMKLICARLLQQDGSISSVAAWLHDAIIVRSAGVLLWMPVKILLEYVIFDCCSVILYSLLTTRIKRWVNRNNLLGKQFVNVGEYLVRNYQ